MSGRSGETTTRAVTIELTEEQIKRLDAVRSERNLSRGQLIGELVDHAKPKRVARRGRSAHQKPNPWAQVWPG